MPPGMMIVDLAGDDLDPPEPTRAAAISEYIRAAISRSQKLTASLPASTGQE
jgi:hypothetical protein